MKRSGYKHKRGIETLSIRPIAVLIGVNDLLAGLQLGD